MDIPRRTLLIGMAGTVACATEGAGGGGAAPTDPTQTPAPTLPSTSTSAPPERTWAPQISTWDPTTFPSGLRAGDPTPTGLLMVGACTHDTVYVVAATFLDGAWVELPMRGPFPVVNGHAHVELRGLQAETLHSVRLATPDGRRHSEAWTGRTPAAEDRDPVVRIGASCCFGKTNRNLPTLQAAASMQLDAFVVHGDAIYTKATTLEGYRKSYAKLLGRASFHDLAQTTPLVGVWDDHEVANDWDPADVDEAQLSDARAAYQEVFPQRAPYRSLRFGHTLELIVLDTRADRSPGQLVSAEQLDWAIDTLLDSPCTFKVVVSSVHVTDHGLYISVDPENPIDIPHRWQGYPDQHRALLDAAEQAGGVVFVTGDMHYGGLQMVKPADDPGEVLWEIAAGPAGSNPWDVGMWLAGTETDLDRYPILLTTWNAVVITADAQLGQLYVEWIGDDGQVLAERELYP